jgi:hypothetical protein
LLGIWIFLLSYVSRLVSYPISSRFSNLISPAFFDILLEFSFQISDLPFVGAWRSLVAHLLWEQGVGGSNPLAPTNDFRQLAQALHSGSQDL